MVVVTKGNLARDYFVLGDYAKSETQIQDVLRTQKQSDAIASLDYLAQIQIIKGDYAAAADTIKRMLPEATKPDSSRQHIAALYATQSFMSYNQRDYAESRSYGEKAVAAWPSSDNTYRLACSLNKLRQAKRAEALVRPAIEAWKKGTPDKEVTIGSLSSVLGEACQHNIALQTQRHFYLQPTRYKRPTFCLKNTNSWKRGNALSNSIVPGARQTKRRSMSESAPK